jgi:GAF domain-containing protein
LELPDYVAPAVVWRTGRSARVDEDLWDRLSGTIADRLRKQGIRSMAASPIIVENRLWGVVTVSSRGGPFPSDADCPTDFTELLATAVGNA